MAELKLDMDELQHLLKLAGVHSHDKGEEEHDLFQMCMRWQSDVHCERIVRIQDKRMHLCPK